MQVLSATTQDWARLAEAALVDGPVCVRHAAPPETLQALMAEADDAQGWREVDEDGARLSEKPAGGLAVEALAALGLGAPDGVRWLRHRPGEHGAPVWPPGGRGFVLDLVDLPRSEDGGLLLHVDADGRAVGRRAEAGALALFDPSSPPVRTLLSPRAPRALLSVVGTFRPS